MFEQSMVSTLVKEMEFICGENNAEKALEVTVSLGALSGIEADTLKFHFQNMTRGTSLEGCKMTIKRENIEVYCGKCDHHSAPPYPLLHCNQCGSTNVELRNGDQLQIEDMALI